MNTADELEKIISKNREYFETADLKNVQEFLSELRRRGLITKQDYNLPPLDTLGKKLYESFRSGVCTE